jgi:hypothetical protein
MRPGVLLLLLLLLYLLCHAGLLLPYLLPSKRHTIVAAGSTVLHRCLHWRC